MNADEVPIGQWEGIRGDLTKELMRRAYIAKAHSTTYHPQMNGLVERQNRTLVNMLRVYCSRYITDLDKYLPRWCGRITARNTQQLQAKPYAVGQNV